MGSTAVPGPVPSLRDEQARIFRCMRRTDIDDRKRAEEPAHSEQELRVLIETLPRWCGARLDGEPDYINQRFADYWAVSGRVGATEVAGRRASEDAEPRASVVLGRETATPVDTTCRFRKADGAYVVPRACRTLRDSMARRALVR